MFRRTISTDTGSPYTLFDIADNAAGTNWYRMSGNHQIVNNNASVNTYRIRFKQSGGAPGTFVGDTVIPYIYYRITGDPATPSGWNEYVEFFNNPENYTVIKTVCTLNDDGYYYGTLNLEAGVSYVFPCGNWLMLAMMASSVLTFSGEHCTFAGKYRVRGGGSRTDFASGDDIPCAYQLILAFTADSGYMWEGSQNVEFTSSPVTCYDVPNVSITGSTLTLTYTVIWYADVVPLETLDGWPYNGVDLTATATPVVSQNGNIISAQTTGCSVTGIPQGGFIPTGESVTLTATAYSGNYFAAVPVARYVDLQGEEQIVRFSRNEDNTVATLTQVFSDIAQNGTAITIEATAVVIPPETWPVEVRTQVNCSVSAPTSYTENTAFTATATPADGYRFDTAPVLTDGTNNFNFTIGEDGTASYNGILTGLVEDVTLYIDATAVEIPKKTWPITTQVSNCIVSGVPSTNVYTEGETLSLTAQANENFKFDLGSIPVVTYTVAGGLIARREFTIDPADDTKATFTGVLDNVMDGHTIAIVAEAIPATEYVDKYGSINVYNVTVANLQAFTEQRFVNIEAETPEEVDLGNYVSKLFRVYCGVGDTFDSKMNVGNYNLNIDVKTPVTDIKTVDCGTLTVNGKNGTANDFNGELQIMLPFIGFQSINIDKALNNPLHLYYKINIVTGESVAILEINSIPAYYWDCKACQEILYLSHVQETFSDYEFKSKFLYGFVPFIVYKYNTDFNNSPVNSDAVREKVLNCVGYFEMTETTPFNAPNMNETERVKIIELLNSGVFYGAEFE